MQFSRRDSKEAFIFNTIYKRLETIDFELNSGNAENIKLVCEANKMPSSYYKMWTDIFKLKWEIAMPGKGKIEISLKLPHFGFPPHAFFDSKSDPVVHELHSAIWHEVYISDDVPNNHGYGYIADDVLQATVLQRYLFGEGERYSYLW
jgi:hypothetical protein